MESSGQRGNARRSGVARKLAPSGRETPLLSSHRQDFRMQIERYESSPLVPWGQNLLRWLWTVDGMPGPSRVYLRSRNCVHLGIYTPACSARSGVTISVKSREKEGRALELEPSWRKGRRARAKLERLETTFFEESMTDSLSRLHLVVSFPLS